MALGLTIVDSMTWGDVVVGAGTLLLAIFTALAAGLAYRSVHLSERQWRAATEPDVHLQVLANRSSGAIDLAIFNAGGVSRATFFAAKAGQSWCGAFLGDGFLKPGERVSVQTQLPINDEDDARAIVIFRSLDENAYVTARGEPRRELGARQGPHKNLEETWKVAYPGDSLQSPSNSPYRVSFPDRE
jgi:hypothetical protein